MKGVYLTYKEFKTGLYLIYHYVPNTSMLFIPSKKTQSENSFQDLIVLKVDTENILEQIKNSKMKKALILMAKGYLQWEVAIMLRVSVERIKKYVQKVKKVLDKGGTF